MKKKLWILIMLTTLMLSWAGSLAAVEATPSLDWSVIACGGGSSQVSSTSLNSTIGQAMVGESTVSSLKLCVGFWCSEAFYRLFLPLILRSG